MKIGVTGMTEIVYPVIAERMKRKRVSRKLLADRIGVNYNTLGFKLRGQREFMLWEALQIRNALGLFDMDLAKLFDKMEET
jgi:transcriptional regulator with XRE-family HTH domain